MAAPVHKRGHETSPVVYIPGNRRLATGCRCAQQRTERSDWARPSVVPAFLEGPGLRHLPFARRKRYRDRADLTRLAGAIGPRGLVMTIQMTMTAYVQQIGLRNGHSFPGIQKAKNGDELELYDLSRKPPVLVKLNATEVTSMTQNTEWTHPPTSAGYTDAELADIIAYLKFVATGVAKEVTVADLH